MIRPDFLYPIIDTDVPISETDLEDFGSCFSVEKIKPWMTKELKNIKEDEIWQFARDNFQSEDETPWEMSPGELAIFKLVLFRQHPRAEIIAATQYGKSLTISRAVLTRVTAYAGDWMLVVPDQKRGRIILNYMIRDTANNDFFASKLAGINIKEKNLLMRLLEEKSKVKLTYQILEDDNVPRYGSIEILTAEARRKQNTITTIMGFGGRNIIADEAALEDDDIDSGIFRMLAGKGEDTFLVKIGNPFFRNHFLKSWKDENYKKVFIDYQIGMAEGRYLESFIDEAKGKPNFDVLFGCKFPPQGSIDTEGWMPLLTDDEVKMAMQPAAHFGEERMGADPADEGINESVIVKRSAGYCEILVESADLDTMDFSGQIILNSDFINSKKLYIDGVGIGAGVYGRVNEVNRVEKQNKLFVTRVNAGEQSADPKFFNKRAEMFWRVREWLKSGGKLSVDEGWYQLTKIKYKPNSKGQLQIMGKDEMRKRGIVSPDIADALALTFYDPTTALAVSQEEKFFMKKMAQMKKKKPGGGYGLRMINR